MGKVCFLGKFYLIGDSGFSHGKRGWNQRGKNFKIPEGGLAFSGENGKWKKIYYEEDGPEGEKPRPLLPRTMESDRDAEKPLSGRVDEGKIEREANRNAQTKNGVTS